MNYFEFKTERIIGSDGGSSESGSFAFGDKQMLTQAFLEVAQFGRITADDFVITIRSFLLLHSPWAQHQKVSSLGVRLTEKVKINL